MDDDSCPKSRKVSTHRCPKAAGVVSRLQAVSIKVSTHSRPKAAGAVHTLYAPNSKSFNTQPPEGGWDD